MDNIFLVRDLIDSCNILNANMGIDSLDQEKVFDTVEHCYFFFVLEAFGIGDGLTDWVSLLYHRAQCTMKMGKGLI